MKRIEARMIAAIRDGIRYADIDGRIWKSGNTEVSQSHHGIAHTMGYQRIISVRLDGQEIAAIRPGEDTVWVSDCGRAPCLITMSRINTLIRCLTDHASDAAIGVRDGSWVQVDQRTGATYQWKGQDFFPLTLRIDNQWLMKAEAMSA